MTSVCFEDVSLQKKDEQGQAVDILRNLSFSVPAGAIFALAGPSRGRAASASDQSPGRQLFRPNRHPGPELRLDIRELRPRWALCFKRQHS